MHPFQISLHTTVWPAGADQARHCLCKQHPLGGCLICSSDYLLMPAIHLTIWYSRYMYQKIALYLCHTICHLSDQFIIGLGTLKWLGDTVKCHYNACHYNANASLTRSILGSQTAPTCPHDHPQVAQYMGYRCEIIAVWSATAAMTPLCSHTNGMKQRHPTCWLCQYSRFMIDLRSNTLIIHLRCSENAINRPIWLPDARMLKTISVAIKST